MPLDSLDYLCGYRDALISISKIGGIGEYPLMYIEEQIVEYNKKIEVVNDLLLGHLGDENEN